VLSTYVFINIICSKSNHRACQKRTAKPSLLGGRHPAIEIEIEIEKTIKRKRKKYLRKEPEKTRKQKERREFTVSPLPS
jgi:macrodomain Ter protein organizer (MatP/YcbG family)